MPKRHKTILISEDEPALAAALSNQLKRLGYAIIVAKDGVETIALAKKEKPDLILLDIIMPRKSGFDVLQELRGPMHSRVPVLILSNLERQTDIETARNLGVIKYLIKANISLRDIVAEVQDILAKNSGNSGDKKSSA